MVLSQGRPGPRPISTFEQFVRFSTDSSGLERTFRLLQATLHILLAIEPLRQIAISLLTTTLALVQQVIAHLSSTPHSKTYQLRLLSLLSVSSLGNFQSSFALGRRFFRVFRFLESFSSAWAVYTSSSEVLGVESYLDISARSLNGLYLLLEMLHFPEALVASSSGETVWGADVGRMLYVEGQRFWFLALVCGVGCGVVRLGKLWVYRAVPGEGSGQLMGGGELKEGESVEERHEREGRERGEFKRRVRRVGRRLVADVMDLVLPGTVVGWVEASGGMVGFCMLGSTWLTGLEVWERCGGE